MNDSKNNQTENEKKGLKKFWEKRSPKNKFYLILLGLFLFALCFIVLYIILGLKYSILFSDIARNLWLLFFAIFGGGLAVWGRKATQTQLENTKEQLRLTAKQSEHTEKQLENSAKINRNDRFAKATEMLSSGKGKISSRGGLYILRDLIEEEPRSEYVRCVDIISYWLVEHGKNIEAPLLNVAIIIIRLREFHEDLEEVIDEHKDRHLLNFWPNLQNVNLEGADLEGLKLPKADMHGANLKAATLLATNLKGVRLNGANLEGAHIGNAELQSANLQKANLEGVYMDGNLQDANMRGVSLKNADLQNINLQGAILANVNLEGSDMLSANLRDANLENAQLQDTMLQDADLQDAKLLGANLQNTDLNNANLRGANLTAEMKDTKNLTKKQILSAMWCDYENTKPPPQLPENLMGDSDVQKWLRNPNSCPMFLSDPRNKKY